MHVFFSLSASPMPHILKFLLVLASGHGGRITQRVSSTWRGRIRDRRRTYACLDLTTWRGVPKSSLRACMARSGGNVRKAVFSRFSNDSDLSILTGQRHKLPILEIRQSDIALNLSVKGACALSNLTVLVTDFRLYTDSFHAILKGRASLRTLECRWIICSSPIGPSP